MKQKGHVLFSVWVNLPGQRNQKLDKFYNVDVGPAEPDFVSLSFRTVPEKCEEAHGRNLSAYNSLVKMRPNVIYESLGADPDQGVAKNILTLALSIAQRNAVLQYSKLRICGSLKDFFFYLIH